ncbi:MarR family winged helix-turn-helix transcriptional regulator [Streptomyces klenkii]
MADAMDLIAEQWRKERPDLAGELGGMELMSRVLRMQSIFERHFKGLCAEHGLGMGEFDFLFTLRRSGPPYTLSAGAFLKAAMVTAGAVTNRVDRMEAKGLVERVRESSDRRSVQVRLTERGKAVADEAIAAHLRGYTDIVSVLDPREREQVTAGLRKILEAQGDTSID